MIVRRLLSTDILVPLEYNDLFLIGARVNFWHAVNGIYMHVFKLFYMYYDSTPNHRWEFFTTLDYEWKVIRGHSPYRWTIWVRAD